MKRVIIKRKKHFSGCVVSYLIILGYDINKFKTLIADISEYYNNNEKDYQKEKYFHEEFLKIKFETIKNGESKLLNLDDKIKTIFVCNNIELSNKLYPTLYTIYPPIYSNQININKDTIIELSTKGGFRKINFILKDIS